MLNGTRVVITGVGLTAPNGNNLSEFRRSLLDGKSGVEKIETHYMGEVLAGLGCLGGERADVVCEVVGGSVPVPGMPK